MNIYQPYLMNIKEITDETVDTRTFRLEFQGSRGCRKVYLQRRTVWRVFGLRRG